MHALEAKPRAGAKKTTGKHIPAAPAELGRSDLFAPNDLLILRKASCACGGGCPACEEDKIIQAKLTVGEPDDEYEREADTIADHVMNMNEASAVSGALNGPSIQLKPLPISRITRPSKLQRQVQEEGPSEEDEQEEEIIQTKLMASASDPPKRNNGRGRKPSVDVSSGSYIQRQIDEDAEDLEEEDQVVSLKENPAHSENTPKPRDTITEVESSIRQKSGSGSTLPANTRNFMEDRFGVDFSGVRIHTDSDSARLNRILNSLAFTTGQDVYFSPGMYRPGTISGDRLLAHELTHVVQQTGGSHLRRATPKNGLYIQRSDTESKSYTQDTATLYGSVAHKTIEKLLEAADTSLITEAPIPGATSGTQELNLVGFADLYKSTDNVVAGVRGKNRIPEGSPTGERELAFENMPTPATSKAIGGAFGRLSSAGTIKHSPRRGKKVKATGEVPWDTTPDFPENFWIGDIKPLRMPVGRGETKAEFQIRNYIEGFQKFVEAAHKGNGGKTRASNKGAILNLTLPASLDYAQFDTEHTKTVGDDHKIKKRGSTDKERIWVYQPSAHPGVYYYFSIPDPYAPADYPKEIERILLGLDPLLVELRQKHPKIPGKIATKRIDGKKAPAPEVPGQQQGKEKKILSKPSGRELVQRTPTPADKDQWKKKSAAWQKSHGTWDKGDKGASKFIEGTARGPVARQEIDKELNIPAGTGRKVVDESDKLKRIKLWSGKSGLALGKLRFYFGDLFDRLMRFFERIKEKFEKWHKGADNLKPKGKLTKGWVGTAVKVILKFGSMILKQALQYGYSAFSACVNGMFDKIIDRFTDDLNEKLHEELNPVAEKIGEMNEKLREEFQEYEGPINMVMENIDQIQQWTSILGALETAIRVGVQVVSCGTPPGLGCLWGLVAQLAIGEALELLSETNYFENHIAKPTANKLMQHFIGNKFQNMVAGTVEKLGLGAYAEGVAECARVPDTSGGSGSGFGFFGPPGAFDPNAPDVVKARQAWEAKYHDKMMDDLLKVFAHTPEKGKKPTPATKEDIEKLVEALKKANLDPEALRALVKGAKPKGGKTVRIDEFLSQLEKVPAEPTRTVTADPADTSQPAPSAGSVPPPTIGTGKKQDDKPADADKGGQAPGAKPTDDKQADGNPLYDANDLPKLADGKGFVDNPNVIFSVEPKSDHEQGKIYDVMVHVFEYSWSTTSVYDMETGKLVSESKPEYKPGHIYSISNVKALLLDKKPGISKGSKKEYTLEYRILENIEVMYQPYPDADPDQHIIPKKNATAILKTDTGSGK